MAALWVRKFLIIICILQANGAEWKARACPPGIATGSAVKLSAACAEEGVEVTWHASRDEVDLVQVEYICRNASTDRDLDEENDMRLLVPYSVDISSRKLIPVSRDSAIECTISGCYEGWFFDVHTISSITWICETPLNEPEVPVPSATKVPPQTSSIQNTGRSGYVSAPAPSPTTTTMSAEPWLITSTVPTISTTPAVASGTSSTEGSSSTSSSIVSSTPSTDVSSSPPPTAIDAGSDSPPVFLPPSAVLVLLAVSVVFLLVAAVLFVAPKWKRWNSQEQLVSAANSYSEPAVLVLKTDLGNTLQKQTENNDSFNIKAQDCV